MQPSRSLRWAAGAALAAAAALSLGPAALAADPAPPGGSASLSEFAEGSPAAGWGRGEAPPPVEVPGEPGDVRFEWPKDTFLHEVPSESEIRTRVHFTGIGVFTFPSQGSVGDPGPGGNPLPSYRQGWKPSDGGELQIGFDASMFGFFLDLGFQSFRSVGAVQATSTWWYRFSDIRVTTVCPGFKIQFPGWLKTFYSGDADWELTWYDYMLHSFPYVKFGVGPVLVDRLELKSSAQPQGVDYWDRGLSYTFFLTVGLEWRPFGRSVSLVAEAGVQAFVFTTETAYTQSPDMLVATPVKIGLSVNF